MASNGREGRRVRVTDPRDQRGVALIIVLTVIAILTAVTVEFAFTSRVDLHLAVNSRDGLRAYYLARSAFNLSRLVIYYQQVIDGQMQAMTSRLGPEAQAMAQQILGGLRLWRMIPIESDFLTGIAESGLQAAEAAGRSTKTGAKANAKKEKEGERVRGFGELPGAFSAAVSDEDSKINLNYFASMGLAGEIVLEQLRQLLAPARYNFMFENRDPDGQYTAREELIAAVVDWVDADQQRFDPVERRNINAPEDAYYQNLADPYVSKNAPFDTLDELHLVRGVGDDFMRLFGDKLTVYPGDPNQFLNVSKSSPTMIMAMLCTAVRFPRLIQYQMRFGCNDPTGSGKARFWLEFSEWRRARLERSQLASMFSFAGDNFSYAELSQFLSEIQMPLQENWVSPFRLDSFFGQKSVTFRIEATGTVGEARRRITAVVSNRAAAGELWYYKED